MRESLRREWFKADPDRIYKNLDCDPLIPNTPAPSGKPVSRLELLDELLGSGPPPKPGLHGALNRFCHAHKKEGPEDPEARDRALGRAWRFEKLNGQFVHDTELDWEEHGVSLEEIIRTYDLGQQRERLREVLLAGPCTVMWSFYDGADPADPFHSFSGERAELVDRLGMGEDESPAHVVVKWGHRLPDGVKPFIPTAWDGGVNRPYWHPGGKTWPLSANNGGTGRFTDNDGLPEVVHDPITGSELAIPIRFVAP